MKSLRQREMAELLGVTGRTVREWSALGLPRNQDGTYPAPECVQWLLRRETAQDLDLDYERARLASAQAEKVEHDNAVRRGELARKADVIAAWTDLIANARQKLLQVPSRLRGELPPTPTPAQVFDLSRRLVHEALTDLAEYQPGR